MANSGKIIGIIAVIVIAIAAVGLYSIYGSNKGSSYTTTTATSGYSTSIQNGGQGRQVPIMMTDPTYAPTNVKAVVITYSNVMVHTTGAGGSGWVSGSGSGTVNITSATVANSTSKLIAYANVSANTNINMVQYTVTSAYVVVNGTAHNVAIANPTVTVNVTGNGQVSQSTAVLVDISPTVVATYSQNTTGYSMSSSSSAVVLAYAGVSSSTNVGSNVALSANAKAQVSSSAPSIVITNATLSTAGNSTRVAVTVKNNANTSVSLNNLILYGQQTAKTNSSLGLNLSITGGILVGNAGSTASVKLFSGLLLSISNSGIVAFSAMPSSSLSLSANGGASGAAGATLAPGASTTLTYNGKLYFDSGAVQSSLKSGSQYNVVVTGSGGAAANSTVTAK